MPDLASCSACGATVADEAQCRNCGAALASGFADRNPYEAPSSSLAGPDEGGVALAVPSSVFGKFGLAFRLLGGNLVLFSLIILTVWLPAAIAIESLEFNAPEAEQGFVSMRATMWIEGVFGPIYLGALIFAVARRMQGEGVGYPEAISVGFRNWGRLFAANFFAGFFIILGCIAFLVPGIILAVRYSLIEPAVILERPAAPRERSTTLTIGRRWQIYGTFVLFYLLFMPVAFAVQFAVGWAQEEIELLNNLWVNVATDCLLNVVSSVITIVMTLFYLEARQKELPKGSGPVEGDETFPDFHKMSPI